MFSHGVEISVTHTICTWQVCVGGVVGCGGVWCAVVGGVGPCELVPGVVEFGG